MVESVDIPTVMSGPVLEIVDLEYVIKDRRLFDGLNMTIGAGESVAVIGPSGSGKSTLLSCVLGLAKPDTGTVLVDGADVMSLRRQALARHRSRSIGMIFQFGELLPELSPIDNVALAALLSRADRATAYSRAATLLDDLGVPRVETTDRLSGGERQRTAVARALINSPSAGNRRVFLASAAWTVLLPMALSGILGVAIGSWLALPMTEQGLSHLSGTTLTDCALAVSVLAAALWAWAAWSSGRQAASWLPGAD